MAKYSLLFIDAAENIGMSKQVECFSDGQAIKMACQEAGDHLAIQICDGERPVCFVSNRPPVRRSAVRVTGPDARLKPLIPFGQHHGLARATDHLTRSFARCGDDRMKWAGSSHPLRGDIPITEAFVYRFPATLLPCPTSSAASQ
jgi:hypothetical protein